MILSIVLLLVGFIILIIGADKLVEAASTLAHKLGVPSIVIGLTIVAFGTSAPELVVNSLAAFKGSSELVLGNVLGSNIFNTLAVLGICSLFYPLVVKRNTTWIEIPLCVLASLVVLIVANDIILDGAITNVIGKSEGLVLLLFFAIFLGYNVAVIKSDKGEPLDLETKNYSNGIAILWIILGLAGLTIGGKLIVDNGVKIATILGMSERIIGLTIVSIGTSLPELATSLVAVRKKNVDLAIGNVVGSNIFNLFFVLGVSASISPVNVLESAQIDILLVLLSSFLLFVFIFTGKGRQLQKVEGIIFLMVYVAYLSYLVVQSV